MTEDKKRPSRAATPLLWRVLRALVQPFRGSAPGATLVEYLCVTGFCALFALMAFNRFGSTLHRGLQEEAKHVKGEGLPNAGDLLSSLGGLGDPNGVCDLRTGICVPGSGFCFAAGTLVATEAGDRAIESIRPGDRVWAGDMETGAIALRTVVTTFITERAPVLELDLRAGSLFGERLRVTPGHRFWVEQQGWVRADEVSGLALGSMDSAVLASVLDSKRELTTVYNLEVAGFHTYFVGRSHALVHNQTTTPTPNNCTGGTGPTGPLPDLSPGKLKCGELGTYGDLSKQQPDVAGSLNRDHVPSNGALRKRAEIMIFGRPLSRAEERALGPDFKKFEDAIQDAGLTIAIPTRQHQEVSETYGGNNSQARQVLDAQNLQVAAAANMAAISSTMAKYDPSCVAAYNASAARVLAMTNAEYDQMLNNVFNNLPPDVRQRILDKYESL